MVSNGTLKVDIEVRPIWRMSIEEGNGVGKDRIACRMKDSPLEMFICTQTVGCKLDCSQKAEQEGNQDYVFRQRMKLQMLVEKTMQGAGDAKRG